MPKKIGPYQTLAWTERAPDGVLERHFTKGYLLKDGQARALEFRLSKRYLAGQDQRHYQWTRDLREISLTAIWIDRGVRVVWHMANGRWHGYDPQRETQASERRSLRAIGIKA